MRLAEIGLRPLSLGQRVVCSHRASALKNGSIRDVRYSGPEHRRVRKLLDPLLIPRRSRHLGKEAEKLQRWVAVWPEWINDGIVIGLTTRSEGWTEAGGPVRGFDSFEPPDYEPPYFYHQAQHLLYAVKSSLRSPTFFVPPWACVPILKDWGVLALDKEEPWMWNPHTKATIPFETYVEAWVLPKLRADAKRPTALNQWA